MMQRRTGVGGHVQEKEKHSRLENGLRHSDVPMLSWISQDSMEKKTQPAGFVERSSFSDSKEPMRRIRRLWLPSI